MNPINFLKEVWVELGKVIWPTKSETVKYTITVIAFSIAVSLILGAADYGLFRLFEKIVQK